MFSAYARQERGIVEYYVIGDQFQAFVITPTIFVS